MGAWGFELPLGNAMGGLASLKNFSNQAVTARGKSRAELVLH